MLKAWICKEHNLYNVSIEEMMVHLIEIHKIKCPKGYKKNELFALRSIILNK
jgi:hypothetical protein